MRTLRRPLGYVVAVWSAVAVISGLAALAGYTLLGDVGPEGRAFLQAFTGGAFIVSIVDGLIPQVFSDSRDVAGFVTAMGFLAGYALSHFLG
jgi:ZIP family zinc transporter